MAKAPSPYEIDVAACRLRQQRLLAIIERLRLDLVIVTQNQHVQYLVGPRYEWTFSPAAALRADGHLTLVAPQEPKEPVAADKTLIYEAKSFSTLRNDQRAKSSQVLLKEISNGTAPHKLGVEFSSCGPELTAWLDTELVDIEPHLYELRRRKDPDELARLRKAIAGTAAMHARSRQIIEPGVNELYVFNELQAAAVCEYGEMMTATGNDYASGERGGHPRDRKIEAGELYILDLGPAFRGYFADNTRVTAVDRKPTDEQRQAYEHILKVFSLVEQSVKPGKSCKELFQEAYDWLNQAKPWVFNHHLGHGIGLFPHEAPHLNPNWDDTFQAGEVFAVEPGLYGEGLRRGIRLENNYLVTETGVELLTPFPFEL
ncbi:MAG TPA: Xaa-Pro peptidase family protein [Pirellulales bacterium]|jgi:Xaa-Pro aminopeptidase|nr:Xaa-Pro peptidase family protein [Pirellulales bacterium]